MSPFVLPHLEGQLVVLIADIDEILIGRACLRGRCHAGETVMEQESCPCRRVNCPRHGDCAACREYHHASGRKPLTRCEKLERKEQRKAERQERKAK